MSRSGYSEDLDPLELGRWRGRVASALRGRRGQALLREFLAALDALPAPRLIAESLATSDGEVCALGALARSRGLVVADVDPDDAEAVAARFGVVYPLACEVMYENDERSGAHYDEYQETVRVAADRTITETRRRYRPDMPEERFTRVRAWVASHLREPPR